MYNVFGNDMNTANERNSGRINGKMDRKEGGSKDDGRINGGGVGASDDNIL